MEAMMIKPPDFDPARRYPVYQFTYAGPAFSSRSSNALGRHRVLVSPAARAARHHRVDLRQPHRQRQGDAIGLAAAQELRCARAAGHRRRRRLAEAPAVCRRIAHRHRRRQLRRVHDAVCADAQPTASPWASPKAPSRTGATTIRFTPSATWACQATIPTATAAARRASPPPI